MDKHQGRNILFELYQAAIDAVHGKSIVADYLQKNPIDGELYVVAIGKAAVSMAEGALGYFNSSDSCRLKGGLIITKDDHSPAVPLKTNEGTEFIVVESAHPIPDQRSLDAGKVLVDTLQTLPSETHVLLLISGGASSLVELLPESVSLQELQQLNQWLIASGLSIKDMNILRREVSLIKQGGLLNYINATEVTALYISDVANNSAKVIGSGLVYEIKKDTIKKEYIKLKDMPLINNAPNEILTILAKAQEQNQNQEHQHADVPEPEASTCDVKHKVLASLAHALLAASECALKKGLVLNYIPDLYGTLGSSANKIALTLVSMKPGILIAGGEISIELPDKPGQGGRNQSVALAVAAEITNQDNIVFMAIGSDGTDGPGTDAGGIVDGETCNRGMVQGLEPMDYLRRADAGTFLETTGDLISTGPTGTNVMDLYIAIKTA